MKIFKILSLGMALLTSITVAISGTAVTAEPVKVGFIYIGPPGDHGWTYRHDIGRKAVEAHFGDAVETTFQENVPEGPDAVRAITQMALSGHDLIFTTSYGYMDQTLAVAKKFPNVKFEHATGWKTADNVSNYGLKLYQSRHVQGVIAGLMTKTNKICYVASFPIPEVIREINTFYLGAKTQNPDVEVQIVWVYTWYDPGKEADAAQAMIDNGCDVITQHTDSPAPLVTAEKAGLVGFGQASDQTAFAPNAQLTGTIDNWDPYYIDRVQAVIDGTWEGHGTYFGDISEGAVGMAPFANMPQNVMDIAMDVRAKITNGTYFAFTGPLKDQSGELRLKDGEVASRMMLDTMDWYVEGITAKYPD